MKRIVFSLALAGLAAISTVLSAQNKPLDHDVYDTWQKVGDVRMSPSGRVIAYTITPGEGDGVLYIRSTQGKGSKAKVSEIAIPRAQDATIAPGEDFLFCRIKPQASKVRSEKIKKVKADKLTTDTLAVVDLRSMEVVGKFGKFTSLASGYDAKPYVAFKTKNDTVLVLKPETGAIDTLTSVDRFSFAPDGVTLLASFKKVKKSKDKPERKSALVVLGRDKSGALLRDTVLTGHEKYGAPTFFDGGSMIAFTASTDTSKNQNKEYSLNLLKKTKEGYALREIIAQGTKVEGTDGWTLNENSTVRFSFDGKRIFTGIAPIRPPKDTSIHDFERAQLDIWNWDALRTPPQQKLDASKTKVKVYSAVIDLTTPDCRIQPLTTSFYDQILPLVGGTLDYAISSDPTAYTLTRDWDYNNKYDIDIVSLKDGSRKEVVRGINLGARSFSPEGKYIAWFDRADLCWHCYNIATGEQVNLTEKVNRPFHNVDFDMPTDPDPYDTAVQWVEGDKAIVIADRYDLWKFSPDGKTFECITEGKGFDQKVVIRMEQQPQPKLSYTKQAWATRLPLKAKGPLNIKVRSEIDMRNGYGKVDLSKKGSLDFFLDTNSFLAPVFSADRSTMAFRKGNFREPYNLYAGPAADFAKAEKLTALETQMEPYRWGKVELMEWNAYDGTPLKGLVFIPDGVKDTDKLPVICYFYERNSETMYDFRMPAPSRSIINISFFTSRGYVVFVPDIVYKDGHPGECAYNCICSGAEAVCEKYPFADRSNMAIQGQSWGGYQTAYLITRTDMFVAAGAGAPVSNMTSAYGGIRWGSGMVRTGQYEHGQSRIGKTLWEDGGLELYLENSPLFHLDKVKTPVLIMHNDNDGAVPWYQGIEMFSGLRRLGKPAWLLEYNREAHNLLERRNCKDYSIRLSQFFDYYMLGAPMPAWMKTGVPSHIKDEYLGLENAE